LRHQRGDDSGIAIGQAELDHRSVDERFQPFETDSCHWCPLSEVRDPLAAPAFRELRKAKGTSKL
jgi:hypothetical protein